jgi:ElaA protein
MPSAPAATTAAKSTAAPAAAPKATPVPAVLPTAIQWQWQTFDALSRHDLYAILQLRSEVFVVEQNCVFQDIDGLDDKALHLLGWVTQAEPAHAVNQTKPATLKLVAYARCFAPGITFAEASIGRVVTHRSVRGSGAGHALMQQAVTRTLAHWGVQTIRIGAQAHLAHYYQHHGFAPTGIDYLEDGIPHTEMLRPAVHIAPTL